MRKLYLPVTYNCFLEHNNFDDTCPVCTSGDVGNETHYLFKCTFFKQERLKYLSNDTIKECSAGYPGTLIHLFESSNDDLIRISSFVRIIMKYFKQYKKHQHQHKKVRIEPH